MILAYSALFLCVLCSWLVLTRRVHMPLLMDLGFFLLSVGMLAVSVSAFAGQVCVGGAVLARWVCNSSGLLLVIVSVVRRYRQS